VPGTSKSRVTPLRDYCFLPSPLHDLQSLTNMVCHILTLFFSIFFSSQGLHVLLFITLLHINTLAFVAATVFMFSFASSTFRFFGFECHQQSSSSLTPVRYTPHLSRRSSGHRIQPPSSTSPNPLLFLSGRVSAVIWVRDVIHPRGGCSRVFPSIRQFDVVTNRLF
jgi:hypothetical protein